MPVVTTVADDKLDGFSAPACDKLQQCMDEFATELVTEAKRIEASARGAADVPDVNSHMVRDAEMFVRRGFGKKKRDGWSTFLRIAAPVLAFLVSAVWDKASLANPWYIGGYGTLVVLAVIAITLSAVRNDG
jgi:hypothetical protein